MLSVPILWKVLGIGAVVGALFGLYTLVVARASMDTVLDELVRERAVNQARDLAHLIERPLAVGDTLAIDRMLAGLRGSNPDLRYGVVRDRDGTLLAHTFPTAPPAALTLTAMPMAAPMQRRLASPDGVVYDVAVGIIDGNAGSVQIGILDRSVQAGLRNVTGHLAWGLALCALLGAGLAVLLADVLVRPVKGLVAAAHGIAKGDLAARAPVFADDEIGRLAASFNQMGDSLERQHRELLDKERDRGVLLARLVQAQEDERKNIARELHDHLGQLLTALLLDIERPVGGEADAEARSRHAGRVRHLVEEVRRMAWGMRPSVLDDYGLVTALSRHADEITRLGRLRVVCEAVGLPDGIRLPGPVEVTLYRIAQEALTNCIRHAQAKQASLVLVRRPGSISMLIEDDGCGMAPDAGTTGAHLGLTSMRERAALLGGSIRIESQPGQGTTLRVEIPVSDTASA
jgi:signal transduction histidine kinase